MNKVKSTIGNKDVDFGEPMVETIEQTTPDPRIYLIKEGYIPIEPVENITGYSEASRYGTLFTVNEVVLQDDHVLFECHAMLSEYELAGDINKIAMRYNPMRPRSWQKIVVAAVADNITFIKKGDEVKLSELLQTHHIDITGNPNSMINTHIAIISKEKAVVTGVEYKKGRYYLIKEYTVGTINCVMLKVI